MEARTPFSSLADPMDLHAIISEITYNESSDENEQSWSSYTIYIYILCFRFPPSFL